MRNIRTVFIAMAALGTAALTASAANAQAAMRGPPYGSYYSYGADRGNPSMAPNTWDQDNPRDQQLQGTR